MTKLDFNAIFKSYDISSEDVQFILKFAQDQQASGELSDVEILTQCVQHLAICSNRATSDEIISLNKQVSNGIDSLTDHGRWTNLLSIAKHAMEMAIEAFKKTESNLFKDSKRFDDMVKSMTIRKAVLDEGYDNFENVFTHAFLVKHGWSARE